MKRLFSSISFIFCVNLILLTFLVNKAIASETISIVGGAAPVNLVFNPTKDPFEKATGIKLIIAETGPKAGFEELVKGRANLLGVTGVSLDELINDLVTKGVAQGLKKEDFNVIKIGESKSVVFVHKENPVKSLTKDQIKGIMTGKITNWKEVGGKDSPIIVVLPKLATGQINLIKKAHMDNEEFTKDVLESTTAPEAKKIVAQTPEAISLGPIGILDDSVKAPEQSIASDNINLITKGEPSPAVKKYIDFLKKEGSKYSKAITAQ